MVENITTWLAYSHLPCHANVFIWRVIIGGLPLEETRTRVGDLFLLHHSIRGQYMYRFIKCPIACTIWKYLSDVWQVLTCYLRPQQWVFSQYVQNGSNDEMEILFQFLHYWWLQHNCNLCNAFMFNYKQRVKAHMKKLKGILMWNFWMLEHVGIISSNAYSGFLMALQDFPLPT